MMAIHPPMAIACYFFVIMNTIYTLTKGEDRTLTLTIRGAWLLCLGGLVTGMIWAEIAWGRYWNWDPKETGTLLLFFSISAYVIVLDEGLSRKLLRILSVTNLLMVIITLFVSPAMDSLHSHYYTLCGLLP